MTWKKGAGTPYQSVPSEKSPDLKPKSRYQDHVKY